MAVVESFGLCWMGGPGRARRERPTRCQEGVLGEKRESGGNIVITGVVKYHERCGRKFLREQQIDLHES